MGFELVRVYVQTGAALSRAGVKPVKQISYLYKRCGVRAVARQKVKQVLRFRAKRCDIDCRRVTAVPNARIEQYEAGVAARLQKIHGKRAYRGLIGQRV